MGHKQSGGERRGAAEGDTAPHQAGHRGQKGRRRSGRDQTGRDQTKKEAEAWRQETGYRPSANQNRDEPMPASHHAPHDQEAVARNAQDATGKVKAGRSGRARKRPSR